MASELPIPREQLFYADASKNPQNKMITPFIDFVHFPTLGCPALLGPDQPLNVLMSLPPDIDPAGIAFRLTDRHRQKGATFDLERQGDPEAVADDSGSARRLFQIRLRMDGVPFALFDLHASSSALEETQYNAVRRYQAITGNEQVIFCGDSQYNVDNQICLQRFIDRVNTFDVSWIAIIGDICDNGVKGWKNLIRLGASAKKGPVTDYYQKEYQRSHDLLRNLRHPVLVVPGNHDGMSAYQNYEEGKQSDVFIGPDALNLTEYDGLHHFRRTFGPLYFAFNWAGTRYLCTNTFEMTRRQRLGYHAIVANWGGWMSTEQLQWLNREFAAAEDRHKVILMHHDPRGGSKGLSLGNYYRIRPYEFDQKWPILKAYLSYVLRYGRSRWQQEWMIPADVEVAKHPVKDLLQAVLQHRVWAVVMGHDDENWVDSYYEGQDLFKTDPSTFRFSQRGEVGDDRLVDDIIDYMEDADYDALTRLLDETDEKTGRTALSAALGDLEREESFAEIVFADNAAEKWGLEIKSAIHFIHVNDIGSYSYSEESDFDDYGFVLANLKHGIPVQVQSHRTSGKVGQLRKLEED